MSTSDEKKTWAGHMSAEARAFLELPPPEPLPPMRADTIGAYREAALAEFGPRAERAVARHGVRVEEVRIGGVPCLDITPGGATPKGTVFYCFGGGYVTGSARQDLIVSAPLCAASGARVVAVEYRLAPEHPCPAALEDGWAVYRALCESEGALAIAGESAGGNMALALMQKARAAAGRMPAAAVLLSPWCDLTHAGDSLSANDGRDPSLPLAYVEDAAELYAGALPRGAAEVSPLFGAFGPDLPPTLITTGTRDLLMSQSVELARRMRAAGSPVELRVHDGLWHVFEYYDELPEAAESLAEAGAFLARGLRGAG
ncbi:MAG: alpha/beta hydrolase [Roseovarius sp.]